MTENIQHTGNAGFCAEVLTFADESCKIVTIIRHQKAGEEKERFIFTATTSRPLQWSNFLHSSSPFPAPTSIPCQLCWYSIKLHCLRQTTRISMPESPEVSGGCCQHCVGVAFLNPPHPAVCRGLCRPSSKLPLYFYRAVQSCGPLSYGVAWTGDTENPQTQVFFLLKCSM